MKTQIETKKHALNLVNERKLLRPRDLKQFEIPESYLWLLAQDGHIQHLGRGLYASLDFELSELQSLLEVCHQVPKGVICLISALQYHQLTTQLPSSVWLAIPAHAHRPQLSYSSLELVQIKPELIIPGLETHDLEAGTLRVFNPARTLADCFKFRNRIGMDVALEALKMGLAKGVNANDIWEFAKILRISKIILPYLEAMA